MPPSRRVVLYGNSIALAGIAVNCANQPGLEVVTIDADDPAAAQRLLELATDVVIFDLAQPRPDRTISLLRDRADLLLLGVDPSSDQMLVLSGHPERVLSTQDLIRVINALPGSKNPLARVPDLARLRQFASAGMALIPTRQRKLVFALVGTVVCVVFALVLLVASPNATVPLEGTALESDVSPQIGLAFGVGIVLGGVIIGLFFWLCRHKVIRRHQ